MLYLHIMNTPPPPSVTIYIPPPLPPPSPSILIYYFYPYTALQSIVTVLEYSCSGQFLATGCDDGTIVLWERTTQDMIARLSGHSSTVTSLSWHATGTKLISGHCDGTAVVWDLSELMTATTTSEDVPSQPSAAATATKEPSHSMIQSTKKGPCYARWCCDALGLVIDIPEGDEAADSDDRGDETSQSQPPTGSGTCGQNNRKVGGTKRPKSQVDRPNHPRRKSDEESNKGNGLNNSNNNNNNFTLILGERTYHGHTYRSSTTNLRSNNNNNNNNHNNNNNNVTIIFYVAEEGARSNNKLTGTRLILNVGCQCGNNNNNRNNNNNNFWLKIVYPRGGQAVGQNGPPLEIRRNIGSCCDRKCNNHNTKNRGRSKPPQVHIPYFIYHLDSILTTTLSQPLLSDAL